MATKDIKDFTKYPSLSDDDYLLGTKTSMGGTDAGILVGALRKQVAADAAPVIKNGYWWSNGVNTGLLATGKTPVFRKTAKGLEYKYEGEDDAAYVLLIPMADLSFTFADLTPDQVLQLKLKFSDLTEADKLALRGKDFTYADFTTAQLDALRLTYDKLTPAQKADIKGERGYSAYEVWTQQPGNTGKTYAQYEAELQKPATDAAKTVTDKMAQIVTDSNTVILNTNAAKDAATTAAAAANAKAGLANTAATNANTAAGAANTAAGKVNTATANAEKATAAADTATTNANTAAAVADTVKQATLQVKKETETVKTDTLKVKEDTIKAKDLATEVANNPTRIDENCTVEIYDPVTNVYNKTTINVKGKAFTYADFTPEQLAILKGVKGDVGKTIQFGIGTVENGSVPSATLTDDGVDASGNPRKKLNLVVQKGDKGNTGFVPVMEAGTATTGLPGSSFTFELIPNGVTAEGAPKYKINMTNPKGDPGTGNGNVRVEEAGIVAGKKYMFVPSRNNISEGTFVEFKIEDFVPAGYELLFTKKATV